MGIIVVVGVIVVVGIIVVVVVPMGAAGIAVMGIMVVVTAPYVDAEVFFCELNQKYPAATKTKIKPMMINVCISLYLQANKKNLPYFENARVRVFLHSQ